MKRRILTATFWLLVLAMIALSLSPALAHSWYDPACCSEHDCARVPVQTVTATPDGWRVQLQPGDHFMVTQTIDQMVPYASALESQDGDFHACIVPRMSGYEQTLVVRCLYVPPMGA